MQVVWWTDGYIFDNYVMKEFPISAIISIVIRISANCNQAELDSSALLCKLK